MAKWIGYIGTLGIGAFLTVLIQEIFKLRLHKRQWNDDIKKTVILKKLQVAEDAMACLQMIEDEMLQLKWICQLDEDIPSNYVEWCQDLQEHIKELNPMIQTKLSRLGVYYDFSELDKKYDVHRLLEEFNQYIVEFSIYAQSIMDFEPTTKGQIRLYNGEKIDIKPVKKRMEKAILLLIDYAEAMQSFIRKDISSYCK